MSFSEDLANGLRSYKSTETTNTIAQFAAVCLDTTNPPDGAVRSDNANAGVVVGINLSTGTDATGTQQTTVQAGGDMRVRWLGVERGLIASGVTVTFGDKLYTTSALQGALTNVSAGGKFVGYAMETSAGGTADIIAVKLGVLSGV